jgi:hypothetical protein
MQEKAKRERTQAEIPYSLLEYTADFKKPIAKAWATPALLVAAVLDALEPFGFNLDGAEANTPQKLNEYALRFRRNPVGVTFTVGIGKLIVAAENIDWTEADNFVELARAGIDTVLRTADAEIKGQQIALAMHVQLKTKPRQEVTACLLSPAALNLLDGELTFPGIILLKEKSKVIVDASVAYANGLFVRIIREHPAEVSFEQMAKILHADEEQLFDTLELEGLL